MSEFQERFEKFIQKENLFGKKTPLLVSLSGGIDSTVMLHLLYEGGFAFDIAHINFRLRGMDSDADEQFASHLAQRMNKKFHVTHFKTSDYAAEKKISLQMAARELRHRWLEEIRLTNGLHFTATAHHLDDSIETALINMIRGTGIHGLHGILPKQNKTVRPMLCFFKNEIVEYAGNSGISYRQDQSNFKIEYDRNKIRLEIIPVIENHFASFRKVFAQNIERWADGEHLLNAAISRAKNKIAVKKNEEVRISIAALLAQPACKTILYEVLKEFNFRKDHTGQIAQALQADPGKMFFSATHRLLKDRKYLIIHPLGSNSISEVLIADHDTQVRAGGFEVRLSEHDAEDFHIPRNPLTGCLDKSRLEFPLVLRRWKKGDYFYPLGMKRKKKKISDYLTDRKIPLSEKENILVIESGEKIACIVGERIDERFKITPLTRRIWMVQPGKK